jgi:hypothetical protein
MVICNEDGFLQNENNEQGKFDAFKEKVVGRSLRFQLTAKEIEQVVIQEISSNNDIKKFFEEMLNFSKFHRSQPFEKNRNIRNIRKCVYMIVDLLRICGKPLLQMPICGLHMFRYALNRVSGDVGPSADSVDKNVMLPEHLTLVESWLDDGYDVGLEKIVSASTTWPLSRHLDLMLDTSVFTGVFVEDRQLWDETHTELINEMQSNNDLPPDRLFDVIVCYLYLSHTSSIYEEKIIEFLDALDGFLVANCSDSDRGMYYQRWARKHSSQERTDDLTSLNHLINYVPNEYIASLDSKIVPKLKNINRIYG